MAGKIQWLSKNGRQNTVVVQKWQAKYSGCPKMAMKTLKLYYTSFG
jgi:hypothetical protein